MTDSGICYAEATSRHLLDENDIQPWNFTSFRKYIKSPSFGTILPLSIQNRRFRRQQQT